MARTKKVDGIKREDVKGVAPDVAAAEDAKPGNCDKCGFPTDACGNDHAEVEFLSDAGINGKMFKPGQRAFVPAGVLSSHAHALKLL